jgi:AraC-like DNA-binding protein/effector-binding domain-containing protein
MNFRTRIQPLLAFAAEHLDSDLSLHALARRAGLSRFHLQRVFAATVGESTKQFALRLRLDRAASQLLTCQESVLSIALASGFENHETFTRAFRRRFGTTPVSYRRRGLPAGLTAAQVAAHARWVRSISPCVSVVGTLPDARNTDRPHKSSPSDSHGGPMSYSITRRELTPQPVLVVRQRVQRTAVATTLATQFGRIFEYVQRRGVALAGQPFLRVLQWGPGVLLVEAGLQVAVAVQGENSRNDSGEDDSIRADVLPGGPAAVTVHQGSYENLIAAHAAVQVWLDEQGLQSSAAPWEVYVTDPSEYPDMKDWKTEIFWPISAP